MYQIIITYIFVITPLIFIIFNVLFNTNIINPFSYLIISTGYISLSLLIMVLFIPLSRTIRDFFDRKIFGLSAFSYTLVHLLLYIVDNNISLKYLYTDLSRLLYIQVGYIAFLLFLPLVFTSTIKAKLALKSKWFKIHQLIYIIIPLSFIHYYLIIKADYSLFFIYLIMFILILILKKRMISNE